MELEAGTTAVVTGAASGIGAALAHRFADAGMNVVLADVDDDGLATVSAELGAKGVETLIRHVDVSQADEVTSLADAAVERFGSVKVVCNNAGVAPQADAWFGPLSTWEWVIGVNYLGVVNGIRAFLPHLVLGGGGHIVNTASLAGLYPGLDPIYDSTKHAIVAVSESLYKAMAMAELPVGVSVLCPGWVNTAINRSDRSWPDRLGEKPPKAATAQVMAPYLDVALAEGLTPAAVAEEVVQALAAEDFWIFPHKSWMPMVVRRWEDIAEGLNPSMPEQLPGMPPSEQIAAEVRAALGLA